jgi:hypothetical protein
MCFIKAYSKISIIACQFVLIISVELPTVVQTLPFENESIILLLEQMYLIFHLKYFLNFPMKSVTISIA